PSVNEQGPRQRFRWSRAWFICLNRARPEGFEPPTFRSVTSGGEFRCVSAAFILCCLSTESGTVAGAQYRPMLGIREQSAPTDAPTPSGLIARRWNEEVRKGEDHRRGSYLSAAPM